MISKIKAVPLCKICIYFAIISCICGCGCETDVSQPIRQPMPFGDIKEVYRHLDKSAAAIYIGQTNNQNRLLGSGVILSKTCAGERKFALLTCYHVASNILLNANIDKFQIGALKHEPNVLQRVDVSKNEIQWTSEGYEEHDMSLGDITEIIVRFLSKGAEINAIDLDSIGCLTATNINNVLCYAGVATTNTYVDLKVKQPFAHLVAIGAEERFSIKISSGSSFEWRNPFNHIAGELVAMFVKKPVSDSSQHSATAYHTVHCFRYRSSPGNSGGGVFVVTYEYEPYLLGILRSSDIHNFTSSVLPIDHAYTLFDTLYESKKTQGDTLK